MIFRQDGTALHCDDLNKKVGEQESWKIEII